MANDMILVSDANFVLLEFTASHSQILLRSVPESRGSERIEVLFKGVVLINIPTAVKGLTISIQERDEPRAVNIAEFSGIRYRLETRGYVGSIIATSIFVSRDNLRFQAPGALLR